MLLNDGELCENWPYLSYRCTCKVQNMYVHGYCETVWYLESEEHYV
jgi:hypothetical protein